jgi:hypothetical protein
MKTVASGKTNRFGSATQVVNPRLFWNLNVYTIFHRASLLDVLETCAPSKKTALTVEEWLASWCAGSGDRRHAAQQFRPPPGERLQQPRQISRPGPQVGQRRPDFLT